VADAGPDQVITVVGTVVHLNGFQSYDPDGQSITYQWSIVSKPVGSKAALTGSSTSKPSFTADVHGDYTIQLIVRDSLGAVSKPAAVQVSFHNVAPVANAGLNQSAIIDETVTLNGNGSTDANGDALTYKWSLVSAPKRSHAIISNSTSKITSFVPPLPPLKYFLSSRWACKAKRSRRQSGPPVKDPEKMVQTGESGPSRDIGDRKRGGFQEFLGMVHSHPQNLVQHSALEFLAKGSFQGSPGKLSVGDDIVHRQVTAKKVSLDVAQGGADVRVFNGQDFSAFASHHSFWRDPLRDLWRWFAVNQRIE
jgi:hypothetical protein